MRHKTIYLKLDEPKAEMVKRLLNAPRKLHVIALTAPINIKHVFEICSIHNFLPMIEVVSLNKSCDPASESGLAPNMISISCCLFNNF